MNRNFHVLHLYQTLDTWSRSRTILGKAEVLASGDDNARFVVTHLPEDGFDSQTPGRFVPAACYEQFYKTSRAKSL